MWQDFRHAVRTLRKHPGFVVLATLVLALGFGLNTAIFSIVRVLLFKPLPVEASHELVSIYQTFARQPDRPAVIHTRIFDFLREHNEAFTDLTAHWGSAASLRANDEVDGVNVEWVLSNYFNVLGVKAVLGRTLLPSEDDVANPARAAVISHALWVRRFRSDPSIIGKPVDLGFGGATYVPFTVVGVMPAGFVGVSDPWKPTQIWMTMAQAREEPTTMWSGAAIARLKPGIGPEQARALIALQGRQWYYSQPNAMPEYEVRLVAYRTNDVRLPFDPSAKLIPRRLAAAMTLVVAVVLLVAATNIAGILMARGVGRADELAVRRVLGAGPLRIVRELLAESILLAGLGASCGLVLTMWLLRLFDWLTPARFALDVELDAAVVLFTAAICLLAGVLVGIAPARQAATRDVMPSLAGSGAVQTKRTSQFRHAITVPQIACSLVLLLVAAIYVRALLVNELTDRGYAAHNLLVANPVLRSQPGQTPGRRTPPEVRAALEERSAERTRRFYERLIEQLKAIPGTEHVAIASWLPLNEPPERPNWSVMSQEATAAGERSGADVERSSVSPDYFNTMRMTMLAGRPFDERDTRRSPKVAIVSTALAQRVWPGRDPIGRSLTIINSWPSSNDKQEWFEVIGVVNDVRPILHDARTRAFVYFALSQDWRPSVGHVLVRSFGDSRTAIPALKDAVERADAFAEAYRVRTMRQMVAEILYPRRVAGAVLAASSGIALLLAIVGVYAIVSYSVAQRSGEIGVRMTLGADRRDIMRLVLREGGLVAAFGSLAGLVFGWTAIRITSSKYLPMPDVDILTLLITPLVLSSVVLLACYLPARRAASLDPMNVLRRV